MKTKTIGATTTILVSTLALAVMSGCGKKEKDDEEADEASETGTVATTGPGISPAAGSTIAMTGQIALEGLSLTPDQWEIISYRYSDGEIVGEKRFPVAADGSFTATFNNDAADIARLRAIAAGTSLSDDDAAFVGAYFDETPATVRAYWDANPAEVKSYLTETANKVQQSGSQALLVAYKKSGDLVAEGQSFKFIGFPVSGGRHASALPVSRLRGNVNMGNVVLGASQNARAGLNADEVIIASAGEMDVVVSTSDLVKSAINRHMNSVNGWELEPFYMFTAAAGHDAAKNRFADLTGYGYHGMGFYVASSKPTTFVWDDICAVSESARKEFSLTPPSTIKIRGHGGANALTDSLKLTNNGGSGDARHETQEGKRVCGTGANDNATGGFYAREDATNEIMINFGTGGSIVGTAGTGGNYSLPTGIWPLKYDGAAIGHFDLASSIPVRDGKPQAPALSAQVNVDGNNVVTSVNVKVMMWNGTAYTQMAGDAVPLLKALVKDVQWSSERTGSGNTEIRESCTWAADGTAELLCTPTKSYTWDNQRNSSASYRVFGMTIHFGAF